MQKVLILFLIATSLCACNKREAAPIPVEPASTPAERPWLQSQAPQETPRAVTPEKPYASSLTGMPPRPAFVSDTLTTDELKVYTGRRGVATISWKTESEKGTFGFYVARGDSLNGPFTRINEKLPVSAAGDSSVTRYYAYYDTNVIVGNTYYYKLEEILMNGSIEQMLPKPAGVRIRSRFIDAGSTGTQARN